MQTLDDIVREDERHLPFGVDDDAENCMSTDDSGKAESLIMLCNCEHSETEYGNHAMCTIHAMSPRVTAAFQQSPNSSKLIS